MKLKHFLLSLAFMALAIVSNGQASYYTTMTNSLDTITNTTPQNCSLAVPEYNNVLGIQVVVTKRTGTLAGKAELQGTIDGTNWKRIATDTLILLNQTTNTYVWQLCEPCYSKYRVLITPSGTNSAGIAGYLLRRRQN